MEGKERSVFAAFRGGRGESVDGDEFAEANTLRARSLGWTLEPRDTMGSG